MPRINNRDLQMMLEQINRAAGFSEDQTLWSHIDGRNVATEGMYSIDGAYGGYKLVQIVNPSGGQRAITCGYVTKRDLYYRMDAFLSGMHAVRSTQHG